MVTTSNFPALNGVSAFYGRIETDRAGMPTDRWRAQALTQINTPYQLRAAWAPEQAIRRVVCNRQVARSLASSLHGVLSLYGSPEAVKAAGMDLFGGCYQFAMADDAFALSAYGITFVLNPAANRAGEKHKDGMMPLEVVELFENEGWSWGGRVKSNPQCGLFIAAKF